MSADEGEGDEAHEVDRDFVVVSGEGPVLLEPVHAAFEYPAVFVHMLVQRGLPVSFDDLVAPVGDHRDDLSVKAKLALVELECFSWGRVGPRPHDASVRLELCCWPLRTGHANVNVIIGAPYSCDGCC